MTMMPLSLYFTWLILLLTIPCSSSRYLRSKTETRELDKKADSETTITETKAKLTEIGDYDSKNSNIQSSDASHLASFAEPPVSEGLREIKNTLNLYLNKIDATMEEESVPFDPVDPTASTRVASTLRNDAEVTEDNTMRRASDFPAESPILYNAKSQQPETTKTSREEASPNHYNGVGHQEYAMHQVNSGAHMYAGHQAYPENHMPSVHGEHIGHGALDVTRGGHYGGMHSVPMYGGGGYGVGYGSPGYNCGYTGYYGGVYNNLNYGGVSPGYGGGGVYVYPW